MLKSPAMLDAIFPIVEGHGDVFAVPELLRRLAHERFQNYQLNILTPFRLSRGKIVVDHELARAVELGARKLAAHGGAGAILVLFDADDDCPGTLGPVLLQRIATTRPTLLSAVVLAKSEYESWFLASAVALRGRNAISDDAAPPPDPEAVRDAKGYMEQRLLRPGAKYSETIDQVALTASMDFDEAMVCPSFRKFYRDMARLLT